MENETVRKLSVKRFDFIHPTETSEEFSLPDYIPEVRRVIGVQAVSSVDGKYLNGDVLEADGCVTYTALYLSGDGGLCAVPLSSAFEAELPVKSTEGDVFGAEELSLSFSVENATCRATAPRRLTISSRVKLHLFSQRAIDCGEKIEPAEPTRLKREKAEYACVHSFRYNGECGGEIREREGTKVIAAQGSVNVDEAKAGADGISISGEARVSVLLLTPDGVYAVAKGRESVRATIPCDTTELLTQAAYGKCLSCEIEAGENGRIRWNLEYDLDCDAVFGGESEISLDGYSTDYPETRSFAEVSALSCAGSVNGRLSVSGSKQVRPGMYCAGGWGRAVFEGAEFLPAERGGGRMLLSGVAYITAILCGEGEASSEEIVVPIKYECEGGSPGELSGKCEITVCDMTGRCDGDALNVTAELAINGVFYSERKTRYLTRMELDTSAPIERSRNVIRICAPDPSEEEWDVQKRYRATENGFRKVGGVYLISGR